MKRCPNVEHRKSVQTGPAAERLRRLRTLRLAAQSRVTQHLNACLDGCEGPFREALISEIGAQGADLAAKHLGPATACSVLGAHAGRVGGQITVKRGHRVADALFAAEGGE
jgi:hypothetical protein